MLNKGKGGNWGRESENQVLCNKGGIREKGNKRNI